MFHWGSDGRVLDRELTICDQQWVLANLLAGCLPGNRGVDWTLFHAVNTAVWAPWDPKARQTRGFRSEKKESRQRSQFAQRKLHASSCYILKDFGSKI
jgi:hypothetical protein